MIPDIAIGAVGAALIGALISLIGLIITKEAKVSEFRQAWIDKLRSELATFITYLNALEDAIRINFNNDAERYDKTKDSISKLNESYFSVALRLNIEEELSKLLRASMVTLSYQVRDSARDMILFDEEKVRFITLSNNLLKLEWNRVKNGEKVYRSTRLLATGAVIGLFILAILIAATDYLSPEHPKSAQNFRSARLEVETRPAERDLSRPHNSEKPEHVPASIVKRQSGR